MSKKTLLAKRVLTALALGSVLYAPVAMAATYTVETDTTVTSQETYKAQDTVYIKNVTLTLDAGALANNFAVGFNIEKANGASTSTLVVKNGHFWVGDEDSPSKLNVDKVIVGDNGHITLDGYGLNIGNNLKTVEINSVAPQGGTAFYYGALYDGPLTAAGDTELDHFGANVTGAGTFFIDADLIFDDSKTGDKYNYTISSGVDILYCNIDDPDDGCDNVKFDCSLTISADQLTGNLPIRNAGNLILTGGRLTRNVVAGTYRHYDYTKPEGQKEWFTEQSGEVYVTGDALTVAEGVEVNQIMYGGREGSNNILNLTLENGSKVQEVFGALAEDNDNANSNAITITGPNSGSASILHDHEDGFSVCGAFAEGSGTANGNMLTLTGLVTYESDILGAASEGGEANNNTLTINNGTFTDRIVAASSNVKASGNKLIITGGNFTISTNGEGLNDIIAADETDEPASATAVFSENGVNISGGEFTFTKDKPVNIMGAYGAAGTSTGNYVSITGGTYNSMQNSELNIYGAKGQNGKVTDNSVDISNVAIENAEIMGGSTLDGSGEAAGNAVTIKNSTLGKDSSAYVRVYGAYGGTGVVSENSVTVENSNFNGVGCNELVGGSGSGNVTGNTVTFKNGVFNGEDIVGGQHSPLADSNKTVSQNNVVIDSGNISVTFGVYGGYSEKGKVSGNNLTIKDGTFAGIRRLTRYAGGFTEGSDASGNTVVVGTETTTPKFYGSAWVIGGASVDVDDKSKGKVSGNSITINNAEFNLKKDGEQVEQRYTHIVAGRGGDGDVTNNNLVIKNITLNSNIGTAEISKNNVWGGFAQNEGNVSGNSITVEKGTLNVNFMAGGSSNYGAATNNIVTITGKDTVINGGTIFGGRCAQGEGEVSGNVVDITDATINANISGGWTKVENKAHDNKVFLNAVTVGSSVAETYSINASKDNKENKGGQVQVKSDGLINNANLTLGGGKVKIDGNVTGEGNLTVNSNTGEINASVTQISLTFGKEGNTTNTVTASMDNIHVTTLTNHGTFNVSGTLNQAIEGNGTNKVLENTTLSMGANASLNNLTLAGTLNLQNDAYATTTIASLTAETGAKVNFDAKFSAAGDQISATTASGTLALGSIGLKEDFDGGVGESRIYTLLTGGATDITLTGSSEAVMGAYKYVFTVGETAGTLTVTKDYGYELTEIIQDSVAGHVAGQVSNYSLNGDKTMDADMGTLTRPDSQVAREFTINGNSHKLLGNGKLGITVNSGDTLTYKDITEVSGFNGAAVTNNGTFNANNVTFKNEIAGNGTMNVDGIVNADAKVANEMNIAGTGTLNIAGANVANTVANEGTFNFLGGNLNYAVTGNGTMNIKADTQFGAKVSNNVVVEESKKLTTDVNFVDGSVDVKGSIDLSGTGTINHELGGRGELMVLKGAVVTFEDVVTGHMTNSGTINFVNGSSYVGNMSSVPNSGSTTNVTGTVNVGGSVISRNINVTDATIVGDTQKTNNRIGGVVTTIIGSTLTDIAVCGIVHSSDDHNASGNKVIVTDSTVGNVYGGNTVRFNFGDKDAKNNIVTISNSVVGGDVIGGYTATGDSEGNTVTLDKVTLTKDRHYVWANMTDSNSQVADDGTVIIGSQGIVNDGETNLGGGKVQIDGNVTGSGNLTISSNTGEINASVTQNSLTIGKEGNTTNTLTASMDNIHVTALTNHGTFNVSGTLNQAINGNGTNKVLENTTLSMGANASLNNLTLAGTLNLQNDAYETTTIANLTANAGAKVNFDAKFSAAGDQINATTASGTLALGSIGLKEDFDGDVGASKIYTLLTNGATDITLTGSSEAVMGAYKYVFTVGETAGTLTVTKDYGYELTEIIQDSVAGHVAGQVGSYSLNGDKTMNADMGTLTRPDSQVAREFTINGNNHKLLGNNKAGITVNSGDTLTYKDISEVSGFNGAAVTNNGAFNATNVTFKNEIAGSGTMYIDGTVNADAKVSNKVNVKTGGVLNANANNIANIVDNVGIYNAEGGTVGYAVTGNGTMNIKADTQFGAKVSNNVVVEESKKLTVIDNLTVGSITLQNAVLDVNEGKVLTTNNLTLTGTSATATMDKANVLNEDLSVKDGWGNIIVGTDGNLNLRFEGIGYTVDQYKAIKSSLFGSGENASLNLLGGNLQLAENQVLVVKGATVDDGKGNMTIGGAKPAVSTNGDEGTEVGAQANQTIVIARANQLGSLNSVAVNANSNIVAKDLKIENIDKDSFTLTVGAGSGDNSILELTGSEDGLIKDENGKEVVIDVTISLGSTFNIGNKDKGQGKNNGNGQLKTLVVGGDVNVYNMGLNIVTLTIGKGGCITFDPGYYAVGNLNFDDGGIVRVLTDGTVLNVDNMDVEKLKKAVEIAGMHATEQTKGFTVADGHAVLALKNPLDLTGGSKHLVVDVDGTPVTKALQLGAGAVLVAQKEEATADTPVVKLGSKEDASIADTAQLVISADKYQKDGGDFISYIVLDQGADEKWAEGNIYAADPTYKFTLKNGKLVADWNKVEGIFGEGAISAPEMYNRILQKEQNTDANKFLKDVINKNASAGSTAATKAAGAAALNAVTSLGELAAVNHGLYTVSNQMTDAVANHMSLIDNEEASRDIWAAYIHNKEDVEELKLGGIDADYSAKYNGVVVGADLAKSDKGNVGVALSYVDGDISGASAGVRTRNDAEYYGASLYGRLDGKDVSLLGDISYMHGKGDITQTAMGQEITADAKSDAISVGLRLEKAFKLGKIGRLMPYIGARYMSINTKDYHNSLGMNYDMDKQNLFMAPVGIAYSAHIEDNGWTYKPTFEAGYVFNMGDKNVDQKVSYNGYGDTFGMDVVDNGYWFGRVGFAAERKHMAYSLGYQYMKSNNAKNSKYMVNVAWKF